MPPKTRTKTTPPKRPAARTARAKTQRRAPSKAPARRESAPQSKAPRYAPSDGRERSYGAERDADGSYFFAEVPWSQTSRLELWRVAPSEKGEEFIGYPRVKIERWDDEYSIGLRAGGSGEGKWQVRCRSIKGQIVGSFTFRTEGAPIDKTSNGVVTANETSLGIITIPEVDPMVNLIFALLQQQLAQERTNSHMMIGTIERLFIAVCTTGKNNEGETLKTIVDMLFRDASTQRARVTTLLDEKAELKTAVGAGQKHQSTKEIVGALVEQVIAKSPELLDAAKRLFSGQPPAELEAGAGGAVASAVADAATPAPT